MSPLWYTDAVTLPNALTFARLLLIPIGIIALLFPDVPFTGIVALVIFVIAAVTDFFDGYFARKWHQTSPLGAFLDPLADKVLVLLYFIVLQYEGLFPMWLLLAMLARDLLNDGFRSFAATRGVVLPANIWGKAKTLFQMLALTSSLLAYAIHYDLYRHCVFCSTITLSEGTAIAATGWLALAGVGLMSIALVAGLIGMWQFFRNHISLLK
jgi:CDP-diacylglycerol---glycerol-3-phosphate 3-phosphatidyltransferase